MKLRILVSDEPDIKLPYDALLMLMLMLILMLGYENYKTLVCISHFTKYGGSQEDENCRHLLQ